MVLINKIKNLVMAFSAKSIINLGRTDDSKSVPSIELSKGEVETLLMMVKEASFKGEHVQKVYELILKLQNYYSKLP